MKPVLLLITALFLAVNVTSQVPDYFGNNPEWRLFRGSADVPCGTNEDLVYYLNGDSIINDTLYKVLFKRGVANEFITTPDDQYPCNDTWPIDEFAALIRQEDRKILLRNYFNSESLLYDFNLSVGDTIKDILFSGFFGFEPVVTSIDSIIINEFYHKRFYFEEFGEESYFLEGVGHPLGFFVPPFIILDFSSQLYCYAQDNTVVYMFEGGELNCDFTISVDEKNAIPFEFIISPNPASQMVNISVGEGIQIKWVRVYSISGKQMLQESMGQNPYQLNMSGLQKGIYLLEIESVDGFQQVERLVLE